MSKNGLEPKGVALVRRILLLSGLLFLILWGISQRRWTFNLKPAAYNPPQPTQPEQKIEVHPEVLNLQESFSKVAETLKPAVVSITTVHIERYQESPYQFFFWDPDDLFEQFFNAPNQPRRRSPQTQPRIYERKIPSTGSGVIIDPEGYILTNEHVVRGADEIKVSLPDSPDKPLDGKVIGRDERTDLAVVKVKSTKTLPYAKLGDSDHLKVGDWSIAVGSPFGLSQTVTVGVISASRQNLAIQGRNYTDLIQTDAAINPGNSGGPLANIHGEVIGINTAIYTPSGGFAGIGFAIPINRAKEIIPQLREKGKVVRGWIGVVLEGKIDEATANVFGIPDGKGALVRQPLTGYPAAEAGLQRGDVIIEFKGEKINDNADLQKFVSMTPPNTQVPIKIIRNKKEMTLVLKVAEAPVSAEALQKGTGSEPLPAEKSAAQEKWMGASFTDLTPAVQQQLSIPDSEKGVVVSAMESGSKAEEIGLMTGDLVRAINQQPVPNLKAFKETIKKVESRKGVVFDILRRGESLYLSYMGPER